MSDTEPQEPDDDVVATIPEFDLEVPVADALEQLVEVGDDDDAYDR